MSRVAVRPSNGDDIEKLAFVPALLGAAAKVGGAAMSGASAVGGALARGAASLGLKGAAKTAGTMYAGKKLLGDNGKEALSAVGDRMKEQAEQRRQQQQNAMQNNLQMAEKAKQNSQINTGEPMDLSWRLLKDWNWAAGISNREKMAIIQTARKLKKKQKAKHINLIPEEHHDEKFIDGHPKQRYKPNQKMPKGAEGLTPVDIGNAMAELFLTQHPELRQALTRKLNAPDRNEPDNTPGMVFHALRTNDPIGGFNSYAPVFGTHSGLNLPNMLTAVDTPAGSAKNRQTIRVSPTYTYNHTHSDLRENLPSIFNVLPEMRGPNKLSEGQKIQDDYNFRKPKPEATYLNLAPDVYGKLGENQAALNIIQEDEKRAKEGKIMERNLAEAAAEKAKEDAARAKEAQKYEGELIVEPHYIPNMYYVTDPAFGFVKREFGPLDKDGQGYDYYHNYYQNQQNVQTGEPMDLAWRMLKEMSDDDIQNWVNYNLESQNISIPQEEEEEIKPKFEMPTFYY